MPASGRNKGLQPVMEPPPSGGGVHFGAAVVRGIISATPPVPRHAPERQRVRRSSRICWARLGVNSDHLPAGFQLRGRNNHIPCRTLTLYRRSGSTECGKCHFHTQVFRTASAVQKAGGFAGLGPNCSRFGFCLHRASVFVAAPDCLKRRPEERPLLPNG